MSGISIHPGILGGRYLDMSFKGSSWIAPSVDPVCTNETGLSGIGAKGQVPDGDIPISDASRNHALDQNRNPPWEVSVTAKWHLRQGGTRELVEPRARSAQQGRMLALAARCGLGSLQISCKGLLVVHCRCIGG